MKGIWVTWELQRRNKGISSALDWSLHEIVINKPRIVRYFFSIIETIKLIREKKPAVIAAQNPSIVLATVTVLLRSIYGYKVIIDAHNSGIHPAEGRSFLLGSISRWLQRKADLTIVTNQELRAVVESNGGTAFVLPDRLPRVNSNSANLPNERAKIVFICTFSVDEPYEEVLKAARMISGDAMIYVTGRYDGRIDPRNVPTNVRLVGFVPEEEFWALLSAADFIMDLTLREGCLVCGAYEGVALSKPLILSDTKVLRSYFSEGCIYVSSNAESIAQGIRRAITDVEKLRSGIRRLKERLETSWTNSLKDLENRIEAVSQPTNKK